jgi:tripartite-type tricarboxylate transporter receptor subunit TctC
MVSRRQFVLYSTAGLASIALAPAAFATGAYPERPVRIIVPFPAGGGTDILARLIADRLGQRMGQRFYVENIAGAGGSNGTGQAARATPDGHTLLFAFSSFVVNPSLSKQLSYDAIKDFEPITLAATTTTVLIVHPSVPATSVQELASYVRANPSKHSYASGGMGTQAHLVGEQLRSVLDLDMVHVPFGGAGPSVQSVVAGHTPIGFTSVAAALQLIKGGELRALAVTSRERAKSLPEVPTMTEGGVSGILGDSWVGVLVPARTPKAITASLHREIDQIIRQPEIRSRLETLGYEPVGSTPEQFAADIKAELGKWADVVRAANIKAR